MHRVTLYSLRRGPTTPDFLRALQRAVRFVQPTETHLKLVLSVGLAAAVGTAMWMRQIGGSTTEWLAWFIWPAMLLHQCEENVFTELALGRRFAFLRWVRSVGFDISPGRALALNVGVGWTLAVAAGLAGFRYPLVPLFVIAVEVVNGFWHLSVTSFQQRWSPGTLSSVLVTVPLGFAMFQQRLQTGAVSPWQCLGLLLLAALSHHRFLGSLPRTAE